MIEQLYKTIEQGSSEWKQARLGHVTASMISDVMAKGKGSAESLTRYKSKVRIIAERLTGVGAESFSNAAMEWGVEQEQYAAIAYESVKDTFIDRTGFWLHPTIQWIGVSPDRLIGDDGLVEIKCPNTSTHLNYLFENRVPPDYYKQIQCQMWVTGRQYCDFVSYDPRLPRRNQLLIVKVERDESLIKEMEAEAILFLLEVENLIIKLGK